MVLAVIYQEHTLESKALAFAQHADYLEQDLAMTKDGRLVVIHDHFLDGLTDVAKKFPHRHRKRWSLLCHRLYLKRNSKFRNDRKL